MKRVIVLSSIIAFMLSTVFLYGDLSQSVVDEIAKATGKKIDSKATCNCQGDCKCENCKGNCGDGKSCSCKQNSKCTCTNCAQGKCSPDCKCKCKDGKSNMGKCKKNGQCSK
ncbi:MAG: hypothetical protein JXA60_11365 [Candidatus Coatesbacteria bacterium]|nr:hypothetical protein [Candidatus Coatesbacteria bacterium]